MRQILRSVATAVILLVLTSCSAITLLPTATPQQPPADQSAAPRDQANGQTIAQTAVQTTPTQAPRLALEPPSGLAEGWRLLFTLPYGDGADQVGVSTGGNGGTEQQGPDYGTQAPDGSWWILDSAHRRLAHFDGAGAYLGDLPLPEEHLHLGTYVQWQRPIALADGRLVLTSTTIDSPGLLLVDPASREFRRVELANDARPLITDGELLYGFDAEGSVVQIDPTSGMTVVVPAMVAQDGRPLTLNVAPGTLTFGRDGAPRSWPVEWAGHPDEIVYPQVEVAVGANGETTIFVTGIVERADDKQLLVGLARFDPSGNLVEVTPVEDPESRSDPGTGNRLGSRLGDDQPWLMFITDRGVRVYARG